MPHARFAADRPNLIQAVIDSALRSPGASGLGVREAGFLGTAEPAVLSDYVGKVREASYKIVDGDIDQLKNAGCSEDFIFELTIAAALGAATDQLDAALRAAGEVER